MDKLCVLIWVNCYLIQFLKSHLAPVLRSVEIVIIVTIYIIISLLFVIIMQKDSRYDVVSAS